MHIVIQRHQPLKLILSFGGDQSTHYAKPDEAEADLWQRVVGLRVHGLRDSGYAGCRIGTVERPDHGMFQCRAYESHHGATAYHVSDSRRLLLLGCSATKRPDEGLLPAFTRYDGPSYKTVRKWIANHRDNAAQLDIVILSARYGLLDANRSEIADYDQRMTPVRAKELMPDVLGKLDATLRRSAYSSMLIHLGADYLPALGGGLLPLPFATTFTVGGIGERLGQLKHWLETPFNPLEGFVPAAYHTS